MIADFEFYKTEYHGIIITEESDYAYHAERASDELALYVRRIPQNDEAQRALKRCACAIADILYGEFKLSKFGSTSGKIASESVSGYYSVSYGTTSGTEAIKALKSQIDNTIAKYLGGYLLGAVKVIY